MSDRIHSLTVVLERDLRDDDAKPIMDAIRQLRGVLSVSGVVTDGTVHTAEERARYSLGKVLMDALRTPAPFR